MKTIILSILLTMLFCGKADAENIINKNLECPRCGNNTYTENYNTNYTKHYFGMCSTCHYESGDESMINSNNNTPSTTNTGSSEEYVYWTPNGGSYHSSRSCFTLNNSDTVYSGTLDECPKSDPCDHCCINNVAPTNTTTNNSNGSEINHIQDKEIRDAYNNLPSSIKKLFNDLECEIYEVDTIIDRYGNYVFGAAGMFSPSGGTKHHIIQIDTEANIGTTYHEFFHLADYGYNGVYESEEDEFMNIYYAERLNFEATDGNTDYAISEPKEYFASAGEEYMINPDKLKANTPMTYNYIHNAVNNIK